MEESVLVDAPSAADLLEPVEVPAASPMQPLWLQQSHFTTDVSSFAPKIVVVGVGGAGGNAGKLHFQIDFKWI